MKLNEKSNNYPRAIEAIKKETEIQNRLQKKIDGINQKIKDVEKEIINGNDIQEKRLKKLIEWFNIDIEKCEEEIEQSKKREKFYNQMICVHDFGVISLEYKGSDGKVYQSGFCLDCDKEIDEVEGPIFNHSIKMSEVVSSFSFKDYKVILEQLKRISDYDNDGYNYIVGERIIDELKNKATGERKK